MFSIKVEFDRYEKILLQNNENGDRVCIVPSLGGIILELILSKNNKGYSIIDSSDCDPGKSNCFSYKGSKLTPFPNRIRDGKYCFKGSYYQLPINHRHENHAIHGLVYDKSFSLVKLIANKVCAELEIEYCYSGGDVGFPWCFRVTLVYTLTNKGIKITTYIKNTGTQDMPFGDGWHPYFKFNEVVDDLMISIPSSKKILVDGRMIPNGKFERNDDIKNLRLIGNKVLDSGFQIETLGISTTQLYSPKKDTKINVWQDSDFAKYNYLQIYIPPSRESIAIEPMTCAPDAFNNHEGLNILSPNSEFKGEYGVYLS